MGWRTSIVLGNDRIVAILVLFLDDGLFRDGLFGKLLLWHGRNAAAAALGLLLVQRIDNLAQAHMNLVECILARRVRDDTLIHSNADLLVCLSKFVVGRSG